MKLVIREYLAMLREAGEFDALLPDLLSAMGIVPIGKPQIGVRQGGVDIAAVGADADGRKVLYLFVVKRGDIGRHDWNSGPTAVRQSLDDVKDIYLTSQIHPEHRAFLKRIVLCTTGDVKQDTNPAWVGYSANETVSGEREYVLWNGDHVAELVETHLFDEYALPADARALLRKALALAGEPEYDLEHFYELLASLQKAVSGSKQELGKANPKVAVRALGTANLSLGILFRWAEADNNLHNALVAAERTLLWGWDLLRQHDLGKNTSTLAAFGKIWSTYRLIAQNYYLKLRPHCIVRDGLSICSSEGALVIEHVFDQIGIIASIGLMRIVDGHNEQGHGPDKAIAATLISIIDNNKSANTPCYDGHIIDISLALLLLYVTDQHDRARLWIQDLVRQIYFSFRFKRGYPIATDSFDDLVDMRASGDAQLFEKLSGISTLLPALAQWCAAFNVSDAYERIATGQRQGEAFANCCFQIWHPDEVTDGVLYSEQALRESGSMEAPIHLPGKIKAMSEQIKLFRASPHVLHLKDLSSYANGISLLDLVASRHFRTPVLPEHWQRIVIAASAATEDNGDIA